MKLKLFIFLFFVSTFSAFAQSKLELEVQEMFWGANDQFSKTLEIPEKWNNESAVIIHKNLNYNYYKSGKKITYKRSIRKRIKLLDKASVEEFSEFSFNKRFWRNKGYRWKKGQNIIGIKIVKPDGSERLIDIKKEAVDQDDEKKLAIANLEIGDIIDYYVYITESFKSHSEYGFDPVETTLGEEYPVMDIKIRLETENDFFINFNTYNGAPELQQVAIDKKKVRAYELKASDIAKNDFPRWFYPIAALPCYKFQVYFARSGKFEDRAMAFLPKDEKTIKKTVSQKEVLHLYDSRFKTSRSSSKVKNYLKKNKIITDRDKVIAAYYYMRHHYLTRYVEAAFVSESKIMYNPFMYYSTGIFIDNEKDFVNHFTSFLKASGISYDIVVATPRTDGDIKDLLIENNVKILLKVNLKQPIYIDYFSMHTSVDQFTPYIEGTDAYLLQLSKNKQLEIVTNTTLPISKHQDNITRKETSITINEDFSKLDVDVKSSMKGHSKSDEQYRRLYYFDYVTEDYKKYGTQHFLGFIRKKKDREKYGKELTALNEKLKEKQKERLEKMTDSDYGFDIEDHKYQLINTGRFGFDQAFEYQDQFSIEKDLIKRAGKNYLLEIGKFIGGQVEIEEKEKVRSEDIYMPYPRSFENEIKLSIPEGYTVAGLDKLNKNIENETGGFISTAVIEGELLKVTTSKFYKNNYEPSTNWSKMVEFLDVAYQFTQEKILLKKQ